MSSMKFLYKFVVVRDGEIIAWENGLDRLADLNQAQEDDDGVFNLDGVWNAFHVEFSMVKEDSD